MRIDDFLPTFQKNEVHKTRINASPETVYATCRNLDLNKSKTIRTLCQLRGMPTESLSISGLISLGFNLIVEEEPNEIVFGFVGKPWKYTPHLEEHNESSFRELSSPGYVKVAWNFHITPLDNRTVELYTESRVLCTDRKSRFFFSFYWFIIRPFSGWIRIKMLQIAKEQAEAN